MEHLFTKYIELYLKQEISTCWLIGIVFIYVDTTNWLDKHTSSKNIHKSVIVYCYLWLISVYYTNLLYRWNIDMSGIDWTIDRLPELVVVEWCILTNPNDWCNPMIKKISEDIFYWPVILNYFISRNHTHKRYFK